MALVWKKALTTAEDSDYKNSNVVVADISDFVSEVDSALASQVTTELVKAVDADGLRLEDDGGNGIFVKDGGNVGIGTTGPAMKLDVASGGIVVDEGSYSAGAETPTDVALILRDRTSKIYFQSGPYPRNLITPNSGNIQIGQVGTVLVRSISLMPGNAGYTSVYSGGSETMRATGGNVGIGVADPHSKLEVNGAISSAVLAVTSANDGTVAVGGINSIFIDASVAAVTINDFTGGVAGQVIYLVVKTPDASNAVTITDTSGSNQELYLRSEADYVFAVRERGGFVFICDGSNWYDVSHGPKHV